MLVRFHRNSYIAGGCRKWYSHFRPRKQWAVSYKSECATTIQHNHLIPGHLSQRHKNLCSLKSP